MEVKFSHNNGSNPDPSHTKGLTDESSKESSKSVGVPSNSVDDCLCSVGAAPRIENYTKRQVISDIALTFDILGWFSPTTILVNIMLQKLGELKLEWVEEVPAYIQEQHNCIW